MMNYYEILEVSQNASQEVIRAAYKTLMQRYHPDKCSNDPETAQLVLAIRLAYDVLSDPELRKAYDIEIEKVRVKIAKFSPSLNINEGPIEGSIKNSPSKRIQKHGDLSNAHFLLMLAGLFIFYFGYKEVSSRMENKIVEKRRADERKEAESAELNKERERRKEAESAELIEAKVAELKMERERRKEDTKVARTIADFGVNLTFKMPDTNFGFDWCTQDSRCENYITIPELGIVVNEEGAEEIVRHIKKNKEIIIHGIRKLLGGTSYKDFTQIESENRLKEIIRDQINLTVIGKKSIYLGEKGVEEILMPHSFSMH
jgi:curved DNA-binding protein CbpA